MGCWSMEEAEREQRNILEEQRSRNPADILLATLYKRFVDLCQLRGDGDLPLALPRDVVVGLLHSVAPPVFPAAPRQRWWEVLVWVQGSQHELINWAEFAILLGQAL